MVLQIIAMNVRVADYGLTESRYMGYLLIAFEVIFIALMIIKKAKYLDKCFTSNNFGNFSLLVGVIRTADLDKPVHHQLPFADF